MAIPEGPYYELPTSEFAAWLRKQGEETWWTIFGDPKLNSWVNPPFSAQTLAEAVAKISRPLLLAVPDPNAHGQTIAAGDLDRVVEHWHEPGVVPPEENPRVLNLSWPDRGEEWVLLEDPETAASVKREMQETEGA